MDGQRSEDWVKAFVEMLPGIAVLLVISYRPTYQHPFGDRTYYWRIALSPSTPTVPSVVRATLGVADVPPEIADVIARKAEGNPFFLEEIGRTLTETGALRVTGGRVVATGPPAALAVPDTVQDVIAARIDRLEESQKRTVQTASVIGREFALSLLRRVSEVEERLESSLTELKRIELIYERAGWGDSEYVFRHALTQDVAYAGLLQAERRRLHARIAAAMEEVYAGRLEEHVEKLVHHFALGEVWDKVVRYAGDAAEKAAGLCVDSKALEFYELALDALRHLPEDAETARVGIDLRLAMRAPLWRSGRPELLYTLFKEAEDLATRFGHTDRLDSVYAFLVQYYWARGEHDQALDYGRRCLERAEARGDLGLRITGLFYTGHSLQSLGRYAESVKTYHEVLALLEGPRVTERFGLSGLPYPCACAHAAEALSDLGDYAGALALFDRGDGVANAAEHLYTKMVLAGFRGVVLVKAGRLADAIAVLEPAVAICREKNFYGQIINTLRYLAAAYVASGRAREGLPLIHESIEMQERASVSVVRGSQWTTVALAHLELGELDQAEQAITTALDFCERQAERGYEAWARCVAGEIAARRGDRATAMQFLDEARNIAEELAMRPLLERCLAAIKRIA